MTLTSAKVLKTLVGFDSTSYKSNLPLIQYVKELLESLSIETTLVHDESHQKANLYATIGPVDRGGVMLSGHTDVVPVAGQHWTSDPFELTCRDNAWFGRGTADMKGFLASALAALPQMTSQTLKTPIHLALSYDEEVGCLGVKRLLTVMQQFEVLPAMAIIGEPTSMTPVTGHKGKIGFTVTVAGQAGHSAYTSEAVNAVEYAAHLIAFINQLHQSRDSDGPFDPGYRVPHTTLHVGTIEGGTALNIIPSHCTFKFEIRNIPEDSPAQLMHKINEYATQLTQKMNSGTTGCSIEFEEIISYPGLNTDHAHSAVRFVLDLLDEEKPVSKVSFGTEGGLFSRDLGIPSVVCGPGNILQAHKPDEYLAKDQLAMCDRMMTRLIERCCAGSL